MTSQMTSSTPTTRRHQLSDRVQTSTHMGLSETSTLDFVARARALVPDLRARSQDCNRLGHLPDETVEELQDTELWRMMTPARYGGAQVHPRVLSRVLEALSSGCASTAWAYNIYLTAPYVVATMPDEAQAEFFDIPGALSSLTLSPSGTARPVDGGYRIKGQWRFSTGQHHAAWALLCTVALDGDNSPVGPAHVLVPRAELARLSDWDVTGLRGTASNTLVADDLFVPAHRFRAMADVVPGSSPSSVLNEDPFYQLPLVPFFASVSPGNAVGMADAAIELMLSRVSKRAITYTQYARQSEATVTHFQMAEAVMRRDQAKFHAERAADALDDIRQRPGDVLMRVRCRADLGWAVELSKQAIHIVRSAAGASSITVADPLSTIVNDIDALSMHSFILFSSNKELYGQVLCGNPPPTPYY